MDYAHSLQNGTMTRKVQDAVWNLYLFDRLDELNAMFQNVEYVT